jgi:hypothetical protein
VEIGTGDDVWLQPVKNNAINGREITQYFLLVMDNDFIRPRLENNLDMSILQKNRLKYTVRGKNALD